MRAFIWLLWRASAFVQGFFALQAKKMYFLLLWPILGHFQCSIVTLVTFRCNHNSVVLTFSFGDILVLVKF